MLIQIVINFINSVKWSGQGMPKSDRIEINFNYKPGNVMYI